MTEEKIEQEKDVIKYVREAKKEQQQKFSNLSLGIS